MRQKRFSFYLLAQVLVIAAVTLLFKFNSDKKMAATEAGALFVAMPVILMAFETAISGFRQKVWLFGVLQFWLLFALPIIGLRLFNWDADFQNLQILGISGPTLHFWSSKSYLLMMAITFWASWKSRRQASQG